MLIALFPLPVMTVIESRKWPANTAQTSPTTLMTSANRIEEWKANGATDVQCEAVGRWNQSMNLWVNE